MRRLIEYLYASCLGIRVKAADIHLTDLRHERMELLAAQAAIAADLERNARQLAAAEDRFDAIARRRRAFTLPETAP